MKNLVIAAKIDEYIYYFLWLVFAMIPKVPKVRDDICVFSSGEIRLNPIKQKKYRNIKQKQDKVTYYF